MINQKFFASFSVTAQVPMLLLCLLPGFARRQMNAALRIYPAWHSILIQSAEILNAVFICRHKKERPGWGEAAPPPQTPRLDLVRTTRAASWQGEGFEGTTLCTIHPP